jgi:carboxylesterase type B
MIEKLWTYIHGGGYLGGFDACELCDPHKLTLGLS